MKEFAKFTQLVNGEARKGIQAQSLDSILAQTYHDWEAILVDDGSTDRSGSIADEYAINDNRFKVIHKDNEGASEARNTAMRHVEKADQGGMLRPNGGRP